MVGEYLDAARRGHGYLWERGRFTPFDVPGQPSTTPTGINNRGQIAGVSGDPLAEVGFLWTAAGSDFRSPAPRPPSPRKINDRGQIVGQSIRDPADLTTLRGFLRDARGRFTTISRPGAAATVAFGINNRGQIVGLAGNP